MPPVRRSRRRLPSRHQQKPPWKQRFLNLSLRRKHFPRRPAETAADFASQWAAGYANNPQLRISESFQKLRQQNRDVVGWLSIAEVLDEPVL